MTDLTDWIGRSEQAIDTLEPLQARRMLTTLGHTHWLVAEDPLPPLWHWIYFQNHAPTDALGPDGHPPKGGFLPPVPLPRRMWAGGRFTFARPARIGETLTRTSTITKVSEKQGSSGPLCFVTVHHAFTAGGEAVFEEEHDIVYREAPAPGAPTPPPPVPPEHPDLSETVTPSMPLLFRYSAVTFNTHRIHYDQDYCREVEGYPGCIVHGPLIATLLAGLAQKRLPQPLRGFEFRATAPLFHDRPFTIHAKGNETQTVWAETPDGGQAMIAKAF